MSTNGHAAPPILLTIAGFDPSCGAGTMADLKTFAAHGCYGVAAITSMTVQNTQAVEAVHNTPSAELREQLGLDKGTRATWTEEKGRLVLTPITERRLDEIMGFLKPGPGEPSAFEMLFEERERERKRENQ